MVGMHSARTGHTNPVSPWSYVPDRLFTGKETVREKQKRISHSLLFFYV